MVPIVLAGLLGTGVAAVAGLGLATLVFRRRPIRIVDYPELPAPPRDDEAAPG